MIKDSLHVLAHWTPCSCHISPLSLSYPLNPKHVHLLQSQHCLNCQIHGDMKDTLRYLHPSPLPPPSLTHHHHHQAFPPMPCCSRCSRRCRRRHRQCPPPERATPPLVSAPRADGGRDGLSEFKHHSSRGQRKDRAGREVRVDPRRSLEAPLQGGSRPPCLGVLRGPRGAGAALLGAHGGHLPLRADS